MLKIRTLIIIILVSLVILYVRFNDNASAPKILNAEEINKVNEVNEVNIKLLPKSSLQAKN